MSLRAPARERVVRVPRSVPPSADLGVARLAANLVSSIRRHQHAHATKLRATGRHYRSTSIRFARSRAPEYSRSDFPDDLNPPKIQILQSSPATAAGLIFVAPKYSGATVGTQGPEIIDDQGRVVWFHALADGDRASDFHVQQYRGEPVLTWSEGSGVQGATGTPSVKPTIDYIVDRSYRG